LLTNNPSIAYGHTITQELCTNCSRGSNGSNACFSNEIERKMQVDTKGIKFVEMGWLLDPISVNFAWLNTRNFGVP